jgi:hypothetical protein
MSNKPDEETTEPLSANDRNYYKVEKWTKDGSKVERMLYAGTNLDKAREVFASAIYHRPRIRLTIRQRSRVLEEWPKAAPGTKFVSFSSQTGNPLRARS